MQDLTTIRLDLTYAVNLVCQHMHSHSFIHEQAANSLLQYVNQQYIMEFIFLISKYHPSFEFSDANWADCPNTRRSTSRYCIFIG